MTRHHATLLAWGLWALTLALTVATVTLGNVAGAEGYSTPGTLAVAWLAIQSYATVGAIVASRRPENPIGWIFLAVPALMMTANALSAYVELAVARSLPGAVPIEVALSWTWPVGIGLIGSFLLLLFPDGKLPSPRWRPVAWFAAVWLLLVLPLSVFRPGSLESPLEDVRNPIGVPGLGTLGDVVFATGGVVVLIASIVALVTRYRRGEREERQQLKWFLSAIGAALFVLLGVGTIAAAVVPGFDGIPDWGFLAALALIPVSVGIAILKYHLYDLGRIVNRTVVYAAVTALLAGLYFGIVLGLQAAFDGITQGNDLAIAGSTLVVAALFRPARGRIQAVVDRRFYRGRYDGEQTLAAFSARLRDEVDLDRLGHDLGTVIHETMQPAHVSLWLREISK